MSIMRYRNFFFRIPKCFIVFVDIILCYLLINIPFCLLYYFKHPNEFIYSNAVWGTWILLIFIVLYYRLEHYYFICNEVQIDGQRATVSIRGTKQLFFKKEYVFPIDNLRFSFLNNIGPLMMPQKHCKLYLYFGDSDNNIVINNSMGFSVKHISRIREHLLELGASEKSPIDESKKH